jgi:hypothetical protein
MSVIDWFDGHPPNRPSLQPRKREVKDDIVSEIKDEIDMNWLDSNINKAIEHEKEVVRGVIGAKEDGLYCFYPEPEFKNSDEWDKLVERIEVLECIVRDKVLDPYGYGPSIGSPGPYYADGSVNPNYKR